MIVSSSLEAVASRECLHPMHRSRDFASYLRCVHRCCAATALFIGACEGYMSVIEKTPGLEEKPLTSRRLQKGNSHEPRSLFQ